MYMALLCPRTSRKSRPFTPHHFTYLHSIHTSIPLPVTTFLTLFLNVFSLQGKDASKPVGNWTSSCLLLLLCVAIIYYVYMCIMRWAGHVARMGDERGVYRVLVGKPEGKSHWGDLGVDGWIILGCF